MDRLLEVVAVILLGIATVGTAWCGLQSSLWNGEEDRLNNAVAAGHAETNRLNSLAAQALSFDAQIVTSYAEAVAAGNDNLQEFYRKAVIREGFLPHLDTWEQQIKDGEDPGNILQNQEYLDEILGPYRESQAQTAADTKAAETAGRWGDQFVLSTVLLAVSLFFAGVTASFRSPTLRVALLTACLLTIAISAGRLADLPIAPETMVLFGMR